MKHIDRKFCAAYLVAAACSYLLHGPASAEENARSLRYTPRPKEATIAWQTELRGKLFHVLQMADLAATGRRIPLNPNVLSADKHEKYTSEEIEINSTAKRRIKVIFTRPTEGTGPFPAVVCIHGHAGHRRLVYDPKSPYRGFATALAERGYATISTDVGQHEVYEPPRLLMAERLWDVMRCVDFLHSRPEVEKNRIGCAGLSLGGEMAMWLGAMDPRISATLSSGFLTTMDHIEPPGNCPCWKFPGLRNLVDFADIYALIAPRSLACQNGLKEPPQSFNVPLARQALGEIKPVYAALGHPENVSLIVHDEGHVIDLPTLLAFFDQQLKGQAVSAAPPE